MLILSLDQTAETSVKYDAVPAFSPESSSTPHFRCDHIAFNTRGLPNLGGHPKPASQGHLKTGQL
jgi:hypothetical protein